MLSFKVEPVILLALQNTIIIVCADHESLFVKHIKVPQWTLVLGTNGRTCVVNLDTRLVILLAPPVSGYIGDVRSSLIKQ